MSSVGSRISLLGAKVGMTSVFGQDGVIIPVTAIRLFVHFVSSVRENTGRNQVDVLAFSSGNVTVAGEKAVVSGAVRSFEEIKDMKNERRILRSYSVDDVSSFSAGDMFSLSYFDVGRFVDVSANTVGKGFAGVMKRHNFRGLEASHGVSVSHRSHGSTGQRQDPGKVFKGKKMAGHMGNSKVTVQNLEIVDLDDDLNLLLVKGCVPGAKNGIMTVSHACKKSFS